MRSVYKNTNLALLFTQKKYYFVKVLQCSKGKIIVVCLLLWGPTNGPQVPSELMHFSQICLSAWSCGATWGLISGCCISICIAELCSCFCTHLLSRACLVVQCCQSLWPHLVNYRQSSCLWEDLWERVKSLLWVSLSLIYKAFELLDQVTSGKLRWVALLTRDASLSVRTEPELVLLSSRSAQEFVSEQGCALPVLCWNPVPGLRGVVQQREALQLCSDLLETFTEHLRDRVQYEDLWLKRSLPHCKIWKI